MNTVRLTSGADERPVVVTRVGDTQWHAMEDGRVVGQGDAAGRPDGRTFISVWHGAVFDQFARVMLAGC